MLMRAYVGKMMLWGTLLVAGGATLGGCAAVYPPTGMVLTAYANDKVVPEIMSTSDVDLSSCGTAMGLHQLVESFQSVVNRPNLDLMGTELLSSFCSEAHADEAHLMYLQALHDGRASAATDFHIVEQRWQKVTTERRYAAYKDFVAAYGQIGDPKKCPWFSGDKDQVLYMTGLITSVLAVLSDIQAGSAVGVPQDIVSKVATSTQCLKNEKWWGVPEGIRAAAYMSVPGITPDGVDPHAVMDHAVSLGAQSGMPLAATFDAITAFGAGDEAREKAAIQKFVAIDEQNKIPKKWAMLAAIGRFEVTYLSDQIWMKDGGSRTPYQGLGRFPGDNKQPAADTSGLL
jgi:hypothetical protein